jgi:hypothetical protein
LEAKIFAVPRFPGLSAQVFIMLPLPAEDGQEKVSGQAIARNSGKIHVQFFRRNAIG